MIPFVIASALTCSEAEDIINAIRPSHYDEEARTELIQIIRSETEGCEWDANAD